jgi:hypothetical protein
MNRMKWLVLMVFALATVPAEAQGFRGGPGNGGLNGLNRNRPGPGIMGGDPAGIGMVGGPRFGPQPPFGGFPGNGQPNGGLGFGGGIIGERQIPNQQPPIFGPQVPMPGIGGRDKDDNGKPWSSLLPHVHPHIPSFRPEESIAGEAKSFRGFSELHPSFRAPSGFRGSGGGFGKWFGAGLAGALAAIGGIFRGIFGSGSKEKTNGHVDQSGSIPLGSNGNGGVWIR